MKDRPVGVAIVGYLTLLSSVYGFVYSFTIGSIMLGGSWFKWFDLAFYLLPLALTLLAVVLGAGILKGWKWVWYALMLYWSATIIASSYGIWLAGNMWSMTFTPNLLMLIPLMPLAFSLTFFLYFQTFKVRDFFGCKTLSQFVYSHRIRPWKDPKTEVLRRSGSRE